MPILLSLSRLCQSKADVACRLTSGALALQCLLFGLFMMAAVRMSQAQDPLSVQSAEVQLEDGRTTLDEAMLAAAKGIFEECARRDAKNARCYYDLGRTDFYIANVRESQRDKKTAQQVLDSAIVNTRRSIDLDDEFADAHALLAELYGRKIGYGGVFTGMRIGPKAEAEVQRALELDRNDPRIYIVLGRRQLYAPRVFGGDIEKAIESFRKATIVDPHHDESFVWLAIAYEKKGDARSAKVAVEEALRLNSRNVIARELRSTIR